MDRTITMNQYFHPTKLWNYHSATARSLHLRCRLVTTTILQVHQKNFISLLNLQKLRRAMDKPKIVNALQSVIHLAKYLAHLFIFITSRFQNKLHALDPPWLWRLRLVEWTVRLLYNRSIHGERSWAQSDRGNGQQDQGRHWDSPLMGSILYSPAARIATLHCLGCDRGVVLMTL